MIIGLVIIVIQSLKQHLPRLLRLNTLRRRKMIETNFQQPTNNESTNTQNNIDILNPMLWNQWNIEAEERAKISKTSHGAIMPSLDHFTYQDYENFYEPSDDTYLFLDALQYEFSNNNKWNHHNDDVNDENDNNDDFVINSSISTTYCHDESSSSSSSPLIICLEVGCGSGVVTVYLQNQWMLLNQQRNNRNLQHRDNEHILLRKHKKSFRRMYNIVTDINPLALKATQSTFLNNHSQDKDDDKQSTLLECIQCDLATSILPQLRHSINIILFNPPYVPTPDEEVNQNGSIAAAWAGGMNGRRVIDRFIPQLVQLLSKKKTTSNDGIDCYDGDIAYMVTVDDNQPYELATLLLNQHKLLMKPLYRRRARNEYLTIQKITWI